ncbi:uncharacterized protein [Spinacia oleracea]|uniref:Uncharacterized protein LOC110787689 n=1 Tax=Spinacia oleracea TaxID=3562 RepID=A0A9R0IET4_SPIOL|nr:uncharacterized protein LOC110787689 [Spinacia oleracea]XP_056688952.1 uncharacterized protein LOC110787689 [Spinacia oleracea]
MASMVVSFPLSPTLKNGTPIACLQQSAMDEEASKWDNALILYVIGDVPTIKYVNTYIEKQWSCDAVPEVFLHSEGYFVIRFGSLSEHNRILCAGPYTIANRPVIVKEWAPNFNFSTEVLTMVPLWIQLPSLPLNCWGVDSLSRIGSILGKPLFANECTTNQTRISYARMLVEIDVTQPLCYKVMVEGSNGVVQEQVVLYDWEPMFYPKCQIVGHVCGKPSHPQPAKRIKKKWVPKAYVPIMSDQPAANGATAEPVVTQQECTWSVPRRSIYRVSPTAATVVPITNPYTFLPTDDVFEIAATNTKSSRGEDPILFGSL